MPISGCGGHIRAVAGINAERLRGNAEGGRETRGDIETVPFTRRTALTEKREERGVCVICVG